MNIQEEVQKVKDLASAAMQQADELIKKAPSSDDVINSTKAAGINAKSNWSRCIEAVKNDRRKAGKSESATEILGDVGKHLLVGSALVGVAVALELEDTLENIDNLENLQAADQLGDLEPMDGGGYQYPDYQFPDDE